MSESAEKTPGAITSLLAEIDDLSVRDRAASQMAITSLIEIAYDELRDLAQSLMRTQPAGHTLQPTALVHEAAIRMLGTSGLFEVRNRAYFFGAMCRAMRRVLVDSARARRALRRGGGSPKISLETHTLSATISAIEESRGIDLIELDEALEQLEARSKRQAEIVTMRFFGGFQMREIAQHLQVSLRTIETDWRVAKAWLHQELRPTS